MWFRENGSGIRSHSIPSVIFAVSPLPGRESSSYLMLMQAMVARVAGKSERLGCFGTDREQILQSFCSLLTDPMNGLFFSRSVAADIHGLLDYRRCVFQPFF